MRNFCIQRLNIKKKPHLLGSPWWNSGGAKSDSTSSEGLVLLYASSNDLFNCDCELIWDVHILGRNVSSIINSSCEQNKKILHLLCISTLQLTQNLYSCALEISQNYIRPKFESLLLFFSFFFSYTSHYIFLNLCFKSSCKSTMKLRVSK